MIKPNDEQPSQLWRGRLESAERERERDWLCLLLVCTLAYKFPFSYRERDAEREGQQEALGQTMGPRLVHSAKMRCELSIYRLSYQQYLKRGPRPALAPQALTQHPRPTAGWALTYFSWEVLRLQLKVKPGGRKRRIAARAVCSKGIYIYLMLLLLLLLRLLLLRLLLYFRWNT